jgi:hypothetical protein
MISSSMVVFDQRGSLTLTPIPFITRVGIRQITIPCDNLFDSFVDGSQTRYRQSNDIINTISTSCVFNVASVCAFHLAGSTGRTPSLSTTAEFRGARMIATGSATLSSSLCFRGESAFAPDLSHSTGLRQDAGSGVNQHQQFLGLSKDETSVSVSGKTLATREYPSVRHG